MPAYLDNNATTRPTPLVVDAMREALEVAWHNPSSVHRGGQDARRLVERSRADLGALIGVKARELTLTGGGTESIVLAIRGVLGVFSAPVLVTTRIEHAAIRSLAPYVEEIQYVDLDDSGRVDLDSLRSLAKERRLVSIQWANNETGVIQPMEEIGAICREQGAMFHSDATQAVGKLRLSSGEIPSFGSETSHLPCDLMSFAPHKFHGPKGVGCLWLRRGVRLRPTFPGSQELGRRGGTENVPGILGAGAAAREAIAWLETDGPARVQAKRDRLETSLLERVPDAVVNGGTPRLWNTTNIGFPGLEAEPLLLLLSERGIEASAGAACSSGSLDPSPVLLALGIEPRVAHGSIRLSLSRETTDAEIDEAIEVIPQCVERLRASGGV